VYTKTRRASGLLIDFVRKNEQINSFTLPMAVQLYHGLEPDALIGIERAENLAVLLLAEDFSLDRPISLDTLLKDVLGHRVCLSSAKHTAAYVTTLGGLTCLLSQKFPFSLNFPLV
jgi:hypothetical protein